MTQIGGKKHHKTAKKHHIPAVGSRAAVFHGNAKHTSGGLEKKDLKKNKHGSIVSKKASRTAKRKKTINRLRKAGYTAKKGQFKLFKKSSKQRGGDTQHIRPAVLNGHGDGGCAWYNQATLTCN